MCVETFSSGEKQNVALIHSVHLVGHPLNAFRTKPPLFPCAIFIILKDLRKETIIRVIIRVTNFRCWAFDCAFQFLFYEMTKIGSWEVSKHNFLFTAAADGCESRKLVILPSFPLCSALNRSSGRLRFK